MTADRFLSYWASNPDWWDYNEKGEAVVRDDAPQEAKDSYDYYMKRTDGGKKRL
jgi:hypothetical protein